MTWYAIININAGMLLFLGDNPTRAASAWEPGSLLARGETHDEAELNAKVERDAWLVKNKKWTPLERRNGPDPVVSAR